MQLFRAVTCQILSAVLTLLIYGKLSDPGRNIWIVLCSQAVLAAMISSVLQQPFWWRIIHLLFLPAVGIMLLIQVQAWIYFSAFMLLLLIFWGTVKGDVPLYLSSSPVSEAVAALVRRENAASFADIGAGIGTIVVPLAQRLPALRITAFECAPLPWLLTAWRCRNLPNVDVLHKNLWSSNLGEFAVIFAFLSPLVMAKLGEKIQMEMRPGSLFVTSSFPVPDWLPESVVKIDDSHGTLLYCYRVLSG